MKNQKLFLWKINKIGKPLARKTKVGGKEETQITKAKNKEKDITINFIEIGLKGILLIRYLWLLAQIITNLVAKTT